jgi:hypothetical protein
MQYSAFMQKTLGEARGGTRTESKLQALSWLKSQLQWEETLEDLRSQTDDENQKAA